MPLSKSPLVSPDMTVTSAVPVSVLPDQKHLLRQKDRITVPGYNTYGIHPDFVFPDGSTDPGSVHTTGWNPRCSNNYIPSPSNIRIYPRNTPGHW